MCFRTNIDADDLMKTMILNNWIFVVYVCFNNCLWWILDEHWFWLIGCYVCISVEWLCFVAVLNYYFFFDKTIDYDEFRETMIMINWSYPFVAVLNACFVWNNSCCWKEVILVKLVFYQFWMFVFEIIYSNEVLANDSY